MKSTYNLTGNGTAGPVSTTGGQVHVQVEGTHGSGTSSIQSSIGEGFVEEASLTADGTQLLTLPQGSQVQVVLSGATSPDLNVTITH